MKNGLEKLGRNAADSSGFPLQIRVADVVRSSRKWNLLVEEYPWGFDVTGLQGFIDVVAINAENNFETLVVQCKRVKETAWVFLIPKKVPKK